MDYLSKAVEKFGNNYVSTNKEGEYIFRCPNCNREKLYLNSFNGVFHCFRCDYKGKIAGKTITSLSEFRSNKAEEKTKSKTVALRWFNRQALTEEQHTAIINRGLTDEDIEYYNITGGKRIQIPNFVVGNLSDLVCFWEWRKDKVTKTNPKYLYSEGVEKSNCLFNIHNVAEGSHITLCEGIFNAITVGREGVASYGRSLSDRQLELILNKYPSLITIAYDSDLPGVTGAVDALEKLAKTKYNGSVDYILLPKGVDANDLGKEKYQEYYEKNKINIDLTSSLSLKIPMLLYKNKQGLNT